MPSAFVRQRLRSFALASCLISGFVIFWLHSGSLTSRSLAQSSSPEPATEDASKKSKHPTASVVGQARDFINADQPDAAIGLLKNFLGAGTGSNDIDDAYLLLAAAYSKKQQYPEAISYLERLLTEFPKSDLAITARLQLAGAYAESGNADLALPLLAEIRSLSPDLEIQLASLKLAGDLYARKRDFARAIQTWREQIRLAPEEQRPAIRTQIRTLVMQKMDKAALVRLSDAAPSEFPGDIALIRLIELHTSSGDTHLAERALHQFLAQFPNHEYAPTASDLLRSSKANLKASQHVIVAALPLSGNQLGSFGIESLNGIRLALERNKETLNSPSVGLYIKDTEGSKASLRGDLSDVIAEYRPVAVIGPLLSRDLQALAGLATQTETPFISPSATLGDLHRLGGFVFSTALTALPQARRISDYAIKRAGYHRFCILHPETTYGHELARLFSQEIRQRGGEIISIESYKEGATDFGDSIKRIKAADLKKYGKTTNVQTSKGTTRALYTPGFDAIFIPGQSTQVSLLAAQLIFYDMKVPFLGTNSWNSSELLRLAGRSLEGGVFTEGFFVDSVNSDVREFVDRYRRRYQSDPSLFSAQAYDATQLILDSLKKGATSGKTARGLLTKGEGFSTLTGSALITPQGTLERPILLIQVKQGKFVQLDE